MEFADAHFAHQDPKWLSHTHQYVEWYKRNKANYESAYFVLHSKKLGVKKKKKVSWWWLSPLCECSRGALHHSSELLKRYLKPSAAEWIHFLLPLAKEQPGPWPHAVTLQSYTKKNDSGKEHRTTVTCTFYSLSNEAPHEVGTVFTPVRAPEGVHLEDRSRKENYRRWPNHFTDISINACKQCTTPLHWRYHMQCLEVSLYHEEKN